MRSILAQLRHAYHNLIGPDAGWNREQRMRFADGLIGPNIERLEVATEEIECERQRAEQAEAERDAALKEKRRWQSRAEADSISASAASAHAAKIAAERDALRIALREAHAKLQNWLESDETRPIDDVSAVADTLGQILTERK